jgi:hypothetical protein
MPPKRSGRAAWQVLSSVNDRTSKKCSRHWLPLVCGLPTASLMAESHWSARGAGVQAHLH